MTDEDTGPTDEDTGFRPSTTAALAVSVGVLGAGLASRRRFENEISRRVDALRSNVDAQVGGRFTPDDLAGLPRPVRRYFDHVLDDGQQYVRSARLRQRGAFRLGGADAAWRPLVATQYVTTRPPGFVWNATIDVAPMLSARVIDLYQRGDGMLRAKLLGAIPVASAGPDPRMDEGELVRYLAEAVWFPTALLPTQGVEWTSVDDRSARATLTDRGRSATVVFHFDDGNEVERVTAERYRVEDDSYGAWTGHFRDYRDRNGLRIPVEADVGWDDDGSYWQATIVGIDHEFATDDRSGDVE
ncbi:DUF6544 family protein [Haloarchaeobius sp. HRN-SO-5]|uniref:DUF6544 family protein n=1 Tax=Haloarchaeobius sp. HRN-SO-5 TaxID=3446118 RepID=UPI003EBCCDED